MSTPVKLPQARQISSMQIVFGSILAISLLLAINFSGRIAAGRRIESERDSLDRVISTLQAQATALKATLSFVNSDAFISRWAHNEGKMVKEGEVLVIPVPGPMTPQPSPTPLVVVSNSDTHPESQNWKLWWQLFFDSPPPTDGN
jgi:cell division protein FtsB